MTDSVIAPIVVLAVSRQEPVHNSADCVRLSLNQQVDVIDHQAVSIQVEWELAFLRRQQRKKLFIVGGRIEYPLAIVAASNNVIEATRNFSARSSSHGTRMLEPVDPSVNATTLHHSFDSSAKTS